MKLTIISNHASSTLSWKTTWLKVSISSPTLSTKHLYLKETKTEVKDFILKKIRTLLVEHVRMFKEIYDREQELRILLEEYQEITKEEEEIEGLECLSKQQQDDEDMPS